MTLLAHWKLDGDGVDATGNGNDLTAVGSPTFPAAVLGQGVDLTASSSQRLQIADNAALSGADADRSYSFWVKFKTLAANQSIVGKYDFGTNNREFVFRYVHNDARFKLIASSNGSSFTELVCTNFGAPSTGAWYFVHVWHDATANQIGVRVNNGTADTASHAAGIFNGTAAFAIGARFSGGVAQDFADALIDDVRVYDQVLTAAEVLGIYRNNKLAHYRRARTVA